MYCETLEGPTNKEPIQRALELKMTIWGKCILSLLSFSHDTQGDFSLSFQEMSVNRNIVKTGTYIVRLWKIQQKTTHFKEPWNGRSWTREKRVLALLSFSHDTQVDF